MRHDQGWLERNLRLRRRRHGHMGDDTSIVIYDRRTHSRYPVHVWLRVGDLAVLLRPNQRMYIMSQLHVDQTVALALQATDIFGNIVDALFENTQWLNSDETVAKSTVSADGNSVMLDPVSNAVGKFTTVNVSTQIGGVAFTASVTESVVAGAVANLVIVETFSPKQAPAPAPAPTPAPAP